MGISPFDQMRETLKRIVADSGPFVVVPGSPMGHRSKCEYICGKINGEYHPVALILGPAEDTSHCRVELDEKSKRP